MSNALWLFLFALGCLLAALVAGWLWKDDDDPPEEDDA